MSFRNLIALFIAFCVLLAPAASKGAVIAHDQKMADCHAKPIDLHKRAAGKASHICCFDFAVISSPASMIHPFHGDAGPIPFNPSLSLTSRAEGFYRPPRQSS